MSNLAGVFSLNMVSWEDTRNALYRFYEFIGDKQCNSHKTLTLPIWGRVPVPLVKSSCHAVSLATHWFLHRLSRWHHFLCRRNRRCRESFQLLRRRSAGTAWLYPSRNISQLARNARCTSRRWLVTLLRICRLFVRRFPRFLRHSIFVRLRLAPPNVRPTCDAMRWLSPCRYRFRGTVLLSARLDDRTPLPAHRTRRIQRNNPYYGTCRKYRHSRNRYFSRKYDTGRICVDKQFHIPSTQHIIAKTEN